MSTESLNERDFENVADQTLRALLDALDALDDGRMEASLQMGVLNIEYQDGTKYVVNSHRAAKQIWMAAERRAWHFDYDGGSGLWKASKDGSELLSTLEAVLSRKAGAPVKLEIKPSKKT